MPALNVTRAILEFVPDQAGEWVARLDCHHRRHIRHRPPLSSYPWIDDPEQRAAHLGKAIECGRCEQRVWPEGLEHYRETKRFDAASTPAGLLADHTTRRGVWGRLEVHSGALELCFAQSSPPRVRIEVGAWAAIPPTLPHHIELAGPVGFHLSFWRLPEP